MGGAKLNNREYCLNINEPPHFFFYSCIFNALIPIFNWYKIQYSDLFLQYVPVIVKRQSSVCLDYKCEVDLFESIRNKGISIEIKDNDDDIIDRTKLSLCQNKPVIVWSDCFYQANIKDSYQTFHKKHCFLVKGFGPNYFIIQDHAFSDSLVYEETKIDNACFVSCIKGYIARYGASGRPVFTSFSLSERIFDKSYACLVSEYIESIKKYLNDIILGLTYINALIFDHYQTLLGIINDLINYKSAVLTFFDSSHIIYDMTFKNLMEWKKLRFFYVRAMQTNNNIDKNLLNEKMYALSYLETTYYLALSRT